MASQGTVSALIGGRVGENWQNTLTNCYGRRWHSRHSNWSPPLYNLHRHPCTILPIALQPEVDQSLMNIEDSRSHSGHMTLGRIPLE